MAEADKITLSKELKEKVDEAFFHIDKDKGGTIDTEEAFKMFKSFAKVQMKELFAEMDENKDGQISHEEWIAYFKRVVASGQYKDDEIIEEVDLFLDGYGLVKFETASPTNEEKKEKGDMRKAI